MNGRPVHASPTPASSPAGGAAPCCGSPRCGPVSPVFQRWGPTHVFDTFWKFAAERQAIFSRRLVGGPAPWTADPVLRSFKFTNAYRASDRTSQFLIREVIYKGDQSPREVFFRTVLFKLFNKIETWRLLVTCLGDPCSSIPIEEIDAALTGAMAKGQRVYSAAYIMPPGRRDPTAQHKHTAHLRLLGLMLKEDVPERVADCPHMEDAFRILRSYPMLGEFLAYQYIIDINYSEVTHFSESEFVAPGPGAWSGLQKCFCAAPRAIGADVIRAVAEHQEEEFLRRGLHFEYLAGRRLQLIDCQNLFCELDKYARVAHPHATGPRGRTRIKQRFTPHPDPVRYWYPPKWGVTATPQPNEAANSAGGAPRACKPGE
jgi:5-hmdU DNA kinase, helical domain